jgi:DNA-binding HxlR family transcriptional regulator
MAGSKQTRQTGSPVDFVLQILSSAWTTAIVGELKKGPMRPSELNRALPRISAKTLTQRLRELEQYGFLRRERHDEIPPRVLYTLTSRGQDLICLIAALEEFGQAWQPITGLASNEDVVEEDFGTTEDTDIDEKDAVVSPEFLRPVDGNFNCTSNPKVESGKSDDSFFTFAENDHRRALYRELWGRNSDQTESHQELDRN